MSAATGTRRERPLVVITTVASDSHTWNLVYLQLLFEEAGWAVENLGQCVPDERILDTAAWVGADLVVVSSVNGHGAAEGRRLIAALREDPRLRGLPIVIGGKLDVSDACADRVVDELLAAGFDAVFADGSRTAGEDVFACPAVVRAARGSERRVGV